MRPQCVHPACTVPIESGWDFCPVCGTDNRPPRERTPVRRHRHEWLSAKGRCVRCGEPADEPYMFNRKWRLRIAGTLLGLGGACLLAIGFLQLGIALPATTLGSAVNRWYARDAGDLLLGHFATILLVLGVVAFAIAGGWMLLKLPAPETDAEPDWWD